MIPWEFDKSTFTGQFYSDGENTHNSSGGVKWAVMNILSTVRVLCQIHTFHTPHILFMNDVMKKLV